jgi:hypothetical protein
MAENLPGDELPGDELPGKPSAQHSVPESSVQVHSTSYQSVARGGLLPWLLFFGVLTIVIAVLIISLITR